MRPTNKIFATGKKSIKSFIPNDLDSTKSTLFGKFYEGIVAQWLVEKEGYIHETGKPSVIWKDINSNSNSGLTKELYDSLNSKIKAGKIHTNSDGLFSKKEKYFLWEAKNWPKWTGGNKDVGIQVKHLLMKSPWLLAKEVSLKKNNLPISGIIFSWWQPFDGFDQLETELIKSIKIEFKFYFTLNIIDDCRKNQYNWYKEIIIEQKNNSDELFKDLLSKP